MTMTPDQYCEQQAAKSGSSFYYSFLFLEAERRQAIVALYAFCREVDDVVDECADPMLAATKLAWWRHEIDALYAGHPSHPVTRALAIALPRFGLQREHLLEIVAGMEMDLLQSRYVDFAELKLYCHRVAGVVGLIAASIFGYRQAATLAYAEELGLAFQLTNIIRDVGEDAQRGRIYLPQEELQTFSVAPADLLQGRYSDGFRHLMEFQIERAIACYDRAMAQLPSEDRQTQRAGLVMAAIYRRLLENIRKNGCRVLDQRASLSPLTKLWLAWRTWIKG